MFSDVHAQTCAPLPYGFTRSGPLAALAFKYPKTLRGRPELVSRRLPAHTLTQSRQRRDATSHMPGTLPPSLASPSESP
eukprot:scaffold85590_cov62-Phaeocystis_antarctica.AAC.1